MKKNRIKKRGFAHFVPMGLSAVSLNGDDIVGSNGGGGLVMTGKVPLTEYFNQNPSDVRRDPNPSVPPPKDPGPLVPPSKPNPLPVFDEVVTEKEGKDTTKPPRKVGWGFSHDMGAVQQSEEVVFVEPPHPTKEYPDNPYYSMLEAWENAAKRKRIILIVISTLIVAFILFKK